jgi:hypothetical protein
MTFSFCYGCNRILWWEEVLVNEEYVSRGNAGWLGAGIGGGGEASSFCHKKPIRCFLIFSGHGFTVV